MEKILTNVSKGVLKNFIIALILSLLIITLLMVIDQFKEVTSGPIGKYNFICTNLESYRECSFWRMVKDHYSVWPIYAFLSLIPVTIITTIIAFTTSKGKKA